MLPMSYALIDFLHLAAAGIGGALCQVVQRPQVFSVPNVFNATPSYHLESNLNFIDSSDRHLHIYMYNGFIFSRRCGAISYHSIGCFCNLLKTDEYQFPPNFWRAVASVPCPCGISASSTVLPATIIHCAIL